MSKSLLLQFNSYVDRILSYQGGDNKTLLFMKNIWIATLGSFFMVFAITLSMLIFDPGLKVLITFGISMLSVQGIFLIATVVFKQLNLKLTTFVSSNIYILISCIAVLKLGGIGHSCGLIFIGLAVVVFSIPLRTLWISIELFVFYASTLVIAVLLKPCLTVAEEVSPALNNILYGINLFWISLVLFSYIIESIIQSTRIEELEKRKLQELDEVKTKFFTNITHEFRTPLTIILGTADLIQKKPSQWIDQGIEKIKNSGNQLLYFVNQLLDVSRLEAGSIPVHLIQSDITKHLRNIIGSFSSLAANLDISLRYKPGTESFLMDYDPEKLIQIISNLLSNALKFTRPGGQVLIVSGATSGNGSHFEIKVSDNGIGISGERLRYVFDRFYRVEEHNSTEVVGTGLGLTIVNELVKILNGTVSVQSDVGVGTIVTVSLPITRNADFQEDIIVKEVRESLQVYRSLRQPLRDLSTKVRLKNDLPLLLIVEDNTDVVQYLTALLIDDFNIRHAENGREGVAIATEIIPDIILSDVMMPVMGGIEFLSRVKTDIRTSHIPVVLLTARADIISKLEGLERGADDYLAKPFNETELRLRLHNLVDSRKQQHARYASMAPLPATENKSIAVEDAFILKVQGLMEQHIGDAQFGIKELCTAIGMSRAQLYRKFNSLTDKTVNDYLRSFRLHWAKELLSTGKFNVSEVAFDVGFKNLSHFSHVFHQEFGVAPSDILKS